MSAHQHLDETIDQTVDQFADVAEQESALMPGVTESLDPTTLPLDQLVSLIQFDSMINPEQFIDMFLVPGGGE